MLLNAVGPMPASATVHVSPLSKDTDRDGDGSGSATVGAGAEVSAGGASAGASGEVSVGASGTMWPLAMIDRPYTLPASKLSVYGDIDVVKASFTVLMMTAIPLYFGSLRSRW